MDLFNQILSLFILALPVACIAWIVTQEEVFREPREFCVKRSKIATNIFRKKFYYLFTCEYCFSHYVTLLFLILTDFHLLFSDWSGYIIAGFAIVFVANIYMGLFALLRQAIKKEKTEIEVMKTETDKE